MFTRACLTGRLWLNTGFNRSASNSRKLSSDIAVRLHGNKKISLAVSLQVTTQLHRGQFLEQTMDVCFVSTKWPSGSHAAIVPHIMGTSKTTVWKPSDIYNLSLIDSAWSLCFLHKQGRTVSDGTLHSSTDNTPLVCSQTQEVQKAMDEKRFEDAVKLRGRYDRQPVRYSLQKKFIVRPSL